MWTDAKEAKATGAAVEKAKRRDARKANRAGMRGLIVHMLTAT